MDRGRGLIVHGHAPYLSHSAAESFAFGARLGATLPASSLLCLFGELGAGKTTFVKGVVFGAAGVDPSVVHSPTFTYLNAYEGQKPVYHFDLYRLHDIDEFLSMGFDEYFDAGGICCIEWSERIAAYLPKNAMRIHFEHVSEEQRRIIIS